MTCCAALQWEDTDGADISQKQVKYLCQKVGEVVTQQDLDAVAPLSLSVRHADDTILRCGAHVEYC